MQEQSQGTNQLLVISRQGSNHWWFEMVEEILRDAMRREIRFHTDAAGLSVYPS